MARFFHRQPVAISLEPKFEHEFRFVLLRGNQPNRILSQSARDHVGFDIGNKSILVLFTGEYFDSAHLLFTAFPSVESPFNIKKVFTDERASQARLCAGIIVW